MIKWILGVILVLIFIALFSLFSFFATNSKIFLPKNKKCKKLTSVLQVSKNEKLGFLIIWRHSDFNVKLNLESFFVLWIWISLLGLTSIDVQNLTSFIFFLFPQIRHDNNCRSLLEIKTKTNPSSLIFGNEISKALNF